MTNPPRYFTMKKNNATNVGEHRMKMRKLPESELEIMNALWEADGPVPRNYFDKKLKERKNWADSTILS